MSYNEMSRRELMEEIIALESRLRAASELAKEEPITGKGLYTHLINWDWFKDWKKRLEAALGEAEG